MIAEPLPAVTRLKAAAPLFSRVDEEGVDCLGFLANGVEAEYGPGERIVREGEPAAFFIVLEGEVQAKRQLEGRSLHLNTITPGSFFGDVPLLLGVPFFASFDTVSPTRIFRLQEADFWQMLAKCRTVTREVLQTMARRLKALEDMGQEQGKLAALGTMAAGLAHELNNPAAAAHRSAAELREAVRDAQDMACLLGKAPLSGELRSALAQQQVDLLRTFGSAAPLDPLEQSDREEQVADWLTARGVDDAWDRAPALVRSGFDIEALEGLGAQLSAGTLPLVVRWLERNLNVLELLRDVEISAARIGEVVRAVRSYSFMDQAPRQEVDLNQGLEDTLAIMAYKLRGLRVIRDYDSGIPGFEAFGGELNQVWTNLIDNAADAAGEGGEIRIRTAREGDWAVVEIRDNGPGIPLESRERLFEPFFTTKALGKGTGLGLVTSQRIIAGRHGGSIRVHSEPGDTRFEVRLPLDGPVPLPASEPTPDLQGASAESHPPTPLATPASLNTPAHLALAGPGASRERLDALRRVPLLAPLIDEGGEVFRLLGEAIEIRLQPGEALGLEGQPAFFSVVVEGELRASKRMDGQEVCLGKQGPGAFLGEIPMLLGGAFVGSVHAITESLVYRFEPETFWGIISLCPKVARLVLRTLAERLQGVMAISTGQEKLSALGTLAAGLAHELNNPASAARRAAVQLREAVEAQQSFACHLGAADLSLAEREFIHQLQREVARVEPASPAWDLLEQSDQVDRTALWLEEAGVPASWDLAPTLVAFGVTLEQLEEIRRGVPAVQLPAVVNWVERTLAATALLREIERSTARIAVLVKAVKSYAFAERSPREQVDLRQSLENALTLLDHKLRGVTLVREFDPALRPIQGYGSELSQVWTSLLDNAADALRHSGEVRVRTALEKSHALVEIRDSGPGIPPEIQRKIWEPFFTTKGVGEGSGLGLVTCYRIVVERHGGDIHVASQPGDTRFQVRLPLVEGG